jgi:hypothetical protein
VNAWNNIKKIRPELNLPVLVIKEDGDMCISKMISENSQFECCCYNHLSHTIIYWQYLPAEPFEFM